MKARTMVYLHPQQLKSLKARAKSEGTSLAALMRRLVGEHLDQRQALPPVVPGAYAKIVALGASGRRDISERHDEYLGYALKRDHAR